LKIGLIGNGRIAKRHLEAISEMPGVEVVGVVERDESRRTTDVESFGGAFFESVESLMSEHPNLSLLSILVESGSHKDVAMSVLKFGVPVLVEKPLALSFSDAATMVRAYEECGVPLFVVKQNRLNLAVRRALSAVQSSELGRVTTVIASVLWCRDSNYYLSDAWRIKRELDGGVVWNQASHYVDLIVQVLGNLKSVMAYGNNFLSPAEAEDTVFAIFSGESGSIGSLQATTTIRPRNFEGSLTISGEKGLIRVGGHALNEITGSTLQLLEVKDIDYEGDVAHEVYGKSHSALYAEVIRDVQGGSPSQFRASLGLHVVAVLEAIELSVLQGREVFIDEVLRGSERESSEV
jgi:UDP-N-acetyl-2-amino-2-deoxyglucuronate dehydrogenase